ncbi:hypothetical protein P154DRAFT_574411 [Amniculicola lignicola CBS 123094]|uniref:Uncharacterized protein n=1 Tax=Amniculicola lignicola CBS 123094 TaxID=1392246 RepID=A0A6A5WKU1_9PLEO|nr:hypothetical protein P154DRAFT_574411 [Amniculicola lignicola CBS 123094]
MPSYPDGRRRSPAYVEDPAGYPSNPPPAYDYRPRDRDDRPRDRPRKHDDDDDDHRDHRDHRTKPKTSKTDTLRALGKTLGALIDPPSEPRRDHDRERERLPRSKTYRDPVPRYPSTSEDERSPSPPRRRRTEREAKREDPPRRPRHKDYDDFSDRDEPPRRPRQKEYSDVEEEPRRPRARPKPRDYDGLADEYEQQRRRPPPRDDGYYSDSREYRQKPRARYPDDRDDRYMRDRDRDRDRDYRRGGDRDRDRGYASGRETGRPGGGLMRSDSKWQKEAKDLFMTYALPVIKKEGGKYMTKQLGAFIAKGGAR